MNKFGKHTKKLYRNQFRGGGSINYDEKMNFILQ